MMWIITLKERHAGIQKTQAENSKNYAQLAKKEKREREKNEKPMEKYFTINE